MTTAGENQQASSPQAATWFTIAVVWTLRLLGAACLIGTLLPLLPSGEWFIRGWDFPRFQLAVVLLGLVFVSIFGLFKLPRRREYAIWLPLLIAACVWQASHVIQFTRIWSTEVPSSRPDQSSFSLLVVNLSYKNDAHEAVSAEIRKISPDVLILIEIDEHWNEALSGLKADYEHRHEEIKGEGLGLALWSKLPLDGAETKYLVEDRRPSIWASISHEETEIQLVAVHPTPPGLDDSTGKSRRDSRTRDAELVQIAKTIAERASQAWIVAGDFNDVAWSHTTRLFKRLSGLKDPRIGRHYMGTFHAKYPLVRFPIDHVFLSDGLLISELTRHRITGSDHFGVIAGICVEAPSAGVTPEPEGDDRSEASEIVSEGKQQAAERGISSDDEPPSQ
ncbi:MAG: hypothetical protein DWQ34_16605 [Planctomycetota bacterium]|nr:MAG: hypothetical protein DWQ34_16605 [Planctomycetota bacterium]REK24310.1 MAG: hypothetical protein DWQ41_14890 [Planctomycetota bacterium]